MEYGKKYTIDGKEYGLFWSVEAHIAYDAWALNKSTGTPLLEGYLQKFICMLNAYNAANKATQKPPKKEELMRRPNYVVEEIISAVDNQEKADSTRAVEAEPVKGKNGKSASPSS